MGRKRAKKKLSWTRWWIRGYWTVLVLAGLAFVLQFVSANPNAVSSTTSMTFNEYVCGVASYASSAIATLAILTIVIAGVTYATSMGGSGSKEGLGGISTAKEMIVAALTGLLLIAMSSFFVGECGVGGGFFHNLFGRYFSGSLTITTDNTSTTAPGSSSGGDAGSSGGSGSGGGGR